MNSTTRVEAAIWHHVECGLYTADLPLWRSLADQLGDPILEVGAGTGRVTLDLARAGHTVTALDHDEALVGELRRHAAGLGVDVVLADARSFSLPKRFAMIAGGRDARHRFLTSARTHLAPGGRVAIAITEELETYDVSDGLAVPVPDMTERDGIVYSSQPTAIRQVPGGYALERRRERVDHAGNRTVEESSEHLASLTASELELEATEAGLRAFGRLTVAPTIDHIGSTVVILGG